MTDQMLEVHTGDQRMVDLGNGISDAVYKAIQDGLDADFVCSIIVGIAADYWLAMGYAQPVTGLGQILEAKHRQAKHNGAG